MKSLLVIIFTLFSWPIQAQEIFPNGCTPLVVDGELVKLSTKKPVVVMLHNLSNNDLWITHPADTDPGAQAGWSSQLNGGKWSALALDETKSFQLSCIESRPGHEQQIPCAGVLAVCKWINITMPEKKSGVFWAGENMDLAPLKAYIERMGFVLTKTEEET